MNATSKIAAFACLLFCAANASAHELHSEPIDLTVVHGQPIELIFPNEFDLIHDKVITFKGLVKNLGPEIGTTLDLRFDWFDPSDTNDPHKFSPWFSTNLEAGEAREVSHEFVIPFCPPQVSIDFNVPLDIGGPVLVQGVFTHHCVPEPGTWVMLASGLAGALAVAYRRRRK